MAWWLYFSTRVRFTITTESSPTPQMPSRLFESMLLEITPENRKKLIKLINGITARKFREISLRNKFNGVIEAPKPNAKDEKQIP
jgi:hypothetical protein